MECQLIDSIKEFIQLKPAWNALNERCPQGNVFMSWEWHYHWWDNYAKNSASKLRILLIKDGKDLVAILPLYLRADPFGRFLSARTLRLLGTGGDTSPDHLAVVGGQNKPEVIEHLLDALMNLRHEWDCMDFSDLDSFDDMIAPLMQRCHAAGLPCQSLEQNHLPYITLPPSWLDYLQSVSANRRSQIRRFRRKFEQQGGVCAVWQDENTLDDAIHQLIALHRDRWQERAEHCAFSSPHYIGFHRDLIHALFNQGRIKLFYLKINGQVIAMLYCFHWQNRYYYFQGGFNSDYAALKPGAVIMGYAIEQAIKDHAAVFDMLKGDYSFKRSLAKDESIAWRFIAYNKTLRGQLYRFRCQVLPRLKKRLFQN